MKTVNLGLIDYDKSYEIQQSTFDDIISGKSGDILIFVEHPPTITLGRNTKPGNVLVSESALAGKSVKVYTINRGGDVTIHCPGQLVIYPIVNLKNTKCDLHWYLRVLEQVIIDLLSEYGITAGRNKGYTGVWVGNKKIASIGVGVRNWVAFHGVGFNINPDLKYFSLINPCGMEAGVMTSMAEILNKPVDKQEICGKIERIFERNYYNITTDKHSFS